MISLIHSRNRLLQNKLNELIKQAKDNEKKQELYEAFGFEVIGANSPEELRNLLLSDFVTRFQLKDVVLSFIDRHQDAERLFFGHDEEARINYEKRLLILDIVKDAGVIASFIKEPLLGRAVFEKYCWMMTGLITRDQIKSAAYLPLLRSGRIIGAMLLLSHDGNRFPQGVGTLFLQKLSAMTAIAVENCLNQQRLKEISYQDVLTQVYNRRYFDLRLNDEIARSIRRDDDLTCMFLDVDHFKKINDTYGHQAGDQVLISLVSQIKNQVRACDIVARYGGEEFVVALPATTLQIAHEIAERLRQTASSTMHRVQGRQFQISISIGIANLRSADMFQQRDEQDCNIISTMLLARADKALYRAKASGRNQIAVFTYDTELL
ncbi:diguanylate cyclase (GGDEF) domain-containing protein [Nitrosomonas aestuarii]|uniref:diguanylate cyclase n=1 Tax=Nitrosomonas aestuarii TaxID=52441 RepID=A0A1I4BK29_9PROT|nr:DUF484 family protein [Nitrosomonas aestuarii]SFK68316.1 diguanylate cyclase (GGDEF) domain-containing protein [Nitrosomonas aestuarii]